MEEERVLILPNPDDMPTPPGATKIYFKSVAALDAYPHRKVLTYIKLDVDEISFYDSDTITQCVSLKRLHLRIIAERSPEWKHAFPKTLPPSLEYLVIDVVKPNLSLIGTWSTRDCPILKSIKVYFEEYTLLPFIDFDMPASIEEFEYGAKYLYVDFPFNHAESLRNLRRVSIEADYANSPTIIADRRENIGPLNPNFELVLNLRLLNVPLMDDLTSLTLLRVPENNIPAWPRQLKHLRVETEAFIDWEVAPFPITLQTLKVVAPISYVTFHNEVPLDKLHIHCARVNGLTQTFTRACRSKLHIRVPIDLGEINVWVNPGIVSLTCIDMLSPIAVVLPFLPNLKKLKVESKLPIQVLGPSKDAFTHLFLKSPQKIEVKAFASFLPTHVFIYSAWKKDSVLDFTNTPHIQRAMFWNTIQYLTLIETKFPFGLPPDEKPEQVREAVITLRTGGKPYPEWVKRGREFDEQMN